MIVGIIAWEHDEFESVQLLKVAKEMGYNAFLFTLQDINIDIKNKKQKLQVFDKDLKEFDVIISRAQLRPEHYQEDLQVLYIIDQYVNCLIDTFDSFTTSESKLITYQKLSESCFNVPDTYLCSNIESVKKVYENYSRIVIKPSFGYAGQDVEKVEGDFDNHTTMINNLILKYGSILVQEYIPHPNGDIRVTTLGSEPLVCFRRIPNDHTWKANVGLGASIELYTPPKDIIELGLKAASCLGIEISGVDIVKSNGKYYIFEVNNCPGWYPMGENGKEVAMKIIEYCISRVKREEVYSGN